MAERLPALDGMAPADAAEVFRDLPSLGLLERAGPGPASRWSILVADPLEILAGSSAGPDPFAAARLALRRLEPLKRLRTATRARVIHNEAWGETLRAALVGVSPLASGRR